MTKTSGLIKSLNNAVANSYLKHSEESLFYSQTTFKAGHMLCCALLRCIKKSLHSSGFSCSLFCLDCFHTWRVFCSHLCSSLTGQPVQECLFVTPPLPVLMLVPLSDDFWQITGSGSKLIYKVPRNVIFGSDLSLQVTIWALEPVQRKEKTRLWKQKGAFRGSLIRVAEIHLTPAKWCVHEGQEQENLTVKREEKLVSACVWIIYLFSTDKRSATYSLNNEGKAEHQCYPPKSPMTFESTTSFNGLDTLGDK